MSRLEEFINENRDSFDDEVPSKEVWQKIELAIPGQQSVIVNSKPAKLFNITALVRWGIAASILLLAGTAVFFLYLKRDLPAVNTANTTTGTTSGDIAATVPEAVPEVNQIAKLIVLKQEELKELSKEQPALYQKFTTDIHQLDSSYRHLKNQLSITPNKEMLIEAMVQNLQLQLNVLNQQLNIINQIKQTIKKV
ncbi:MAG: hypothetical protein IPP72_18555 [Chitinophagaceae bacterium]|nr:hypothetical protein [Chitinophagaceae bacterium]